ncbi:helix-turn-helix domain-containing protein [Bradyrhizobium sp. SRS-191]|uniref:helix-turn-helix domain-containing protein n=1 Tax=Bradyrhizobium sp. SRS-191 TaxID=2962606 RepID=UPI00211E7F9B|nr:helix-turn-helix domain-containing protein [Bradyrhizobium sp. SRS-191]
MKVAKRRPRRIAADEAHAWARNLRLGNIQAKMVLSMLALYVDGDGVCFVGIPTLAEDCELSADTVRRRLSWLDEIGAIRRTAQWLDSCGNRNTEGRGKRTSDKIKLLYDADPDPIEARARGERVPKATAGAVAVSPSWLPGLNPNGAEFSPGEHQGVLPLVSPKPGLDQTSHCSQGLISEPEPESSPLPPSKGDAIRMDLLKTNRKTSRQHGAAIRNMVECDEISRSLDFGR